MPLNLREFRGHGARVDQSPGGTRRIRAAGLNAGPRKPTARAAAVSASWTRRSATTRYPSCRLTGREALANHCSTAPVVGRVRTSQRMKSSLLSLSCPRCPRSVPAAVPGTLSRRAPMKSVTRQPLRPSSLQSVPCPRPALPCARPLNSHDGSHIGTDRRRSRADRSTAQIDRQPNPWPGARPVSCWCSSLAECRAKMVPTTAATSGPHSPGLPAGSSLPTAAQTKAQGADWRAGHELEGRRPAQGRAVHSQGRRVAAQAWRSGRCTTSPPLRRRSR
jgi:hypothetical protein